MKKTPFYENLETLCQHQGIEITKLGERTSVKFSGASVSRWKTGVMPRNETIKSIADFFCVDVGWLTGKTDAVETVQPTEGDCDNCPCRERCDRCLTPQELQIIRNYRSASELGKMRMIAELMRIWERDQTE